MDSYFNNDLPKCGHRRKYLINAVPREIAFAHSMLKHCMQYFPTTRLKRAKTFCCSGDYALLDRKAFCCIIPTFTFLLLAYLSGVPLAEDRYDESFGLDLDYLEYKHSTSALIMLPPSIYRSIPKPIKRWCLFELKRYSRKLQKLRSTEHKALRATYQVIS
ncbi:unnamed protein product [Peronospora belbahrii]|uniref:Uncharacterized protein n=1 Tax=Peronospora belbahrii TaxID=622444 RepID=A0ABN8CTL0_9STRA|nr:unnamed protein product [Peronospora belbahrii]